MEAFVDNVWSTPSRLHFRICVVTNPRHRLFKREVSIPLEDLAAVDIQHLVDAAPVEIDPVRDGQAVLW